MPVLKNLRFFLFALLFPSFTACKAQQSCPKWGPYVKTVNLHKLSAELMMADVMMPADGFAPYTYACSVQFGIGKSGGYSGIQLAGPDEARLPNNIFSIWDFPNKIQITAPYKDPLTFIGGFGGEGTGLHSHADFGWKPGRWYTTIIRRWAGTDSTTQVGYWIYDQTEKTYRHYVTFSVPEKNAMLHGDIGSFLENFADAEKRSRTAVYKSYWVMTDEARWVHPDSLVAEAGEGSWKAAPYGKDGVQVTSCGNNLFQKKTFYRISMPEKPLLNPVSIYDMAAFYDGSHKKLVINWSVLQAATPQLDYEIRLFDKEDCSGTPMMTASGTDPDLTSISIGLSSLNIDHQNYYLTLQIRDIFGQLSPVKKFEMEKKKP